MSLTPPTMNVFQEAVCPEYPEVKINDPVSTTITAGNSFRIEPSAGLFNDITVKCEPAPVGVDDTAAADTADENQAEGFIAMQAKLGGSLGFAVNDLYFLLMLLGLVYYVINDSNPL